MRGLLGEVAKRFKQSDMKKLFILSLLLVSCSPESVGEELDCNCNRIKAVTKVKIIGTPEKPEGFWTVRYTTINDCTEIQNSFNRTYTQEGWIKEVGDCL